MSPQGAQQVSSTLLSSSTLVDSARGEEEDEGSRGGGGGRRRHSSHDSSSNKPGDGKVRCTDFSSLKVPFPWRLWQLLEDSEKNGNESIVSWLLDGNGFSISKPYAFTNSIMKSYFALTTYDSFIQELHRYGFIRTMVELNDPEKRVVDVFRNPRYNRKEKVKSLAIRRRYIVQSFSLRLSAKKQKQDAKENVLTCTALSSSSSSYHQDSGGPPHHHQNPPYPVSTSFLSSTTTGSRSTRPRSRSLPTEAQTAGTNLNNQWWSFYKNKNDDGAPPPHDTRNVGVVGARTMGNPGLVCNSDISGNSFRDERSFQPSTISAFNGKVNRSGGVKNNVSSSLPLVDLIRANTHVPAYYPQAHQANNDEEYNSCLNMRKDYESWDTTWIRHENQDEVHDGIASHNLETNWSDSSSWCLETMYKPTLAVMLQLSRSHSTTSFSKLSKILDDVELQSELERILDEDVMESIFD